MWGACGAERGSISVCGVWYGKPKGRDFKKGATEANVLLGYTREGGRALSVYTLPYSKGRNRGTYHRAAACLMCCMGLAVVGGMCSS